jgi:hypothetical protein
MTIPAGSRADVEIREEVDVVNVDPRFLERQRNRYASRGVAFIVLLNGVAAIVLLGVLSQRSPAAGEMKPLADAMVVFGFGAVLGLTSAFFAYLSRTWRLERPGLITWRRPLRWLAVAAAIAGAACFVTALTMARNSAIPKEAATQNSTPPGENAPSPSPEPRQP